jgi:hypothetical protein
VLAALALVALLLTMLQPSALTTRITLGLLFVPLVDGARWLSPVGLATVGSAAAFVARCWRTSRPLVDVRQWVEVTREADVPGAGLLAVCLSGVVLAFATADPQVSVFAPVGPWLLAVSVLAGLLFWWRNGRTEHPLVPRRSLSRPPAWGALAVSFFVGAALIAALVDVPIFARVTVYPDSQLDAALVLLRLLVALPVGALAGGLLTRRLPAGVVTAAGMVLAAAGFAGMARWGLTSLADPVATVPLVAAGLGFGLALAPVNAALLAATEQAVHGVTSALLVVARMVGMLVGISVLTTVGLRHYYAVQADLPSPAQVCSGRTQCAAYTTLLRDAGLAQLQAVFVGAAACAALAAVLALVLFRSAQTRAIAPAAMLGPAG